jgi:hypothetical protein
MFIPSSEMSATGYAAILHSKQIRIVLSNTQSMARRTLRMRSEGWGMLKNDVSLAQN